MMKLVKSPSSAIPTRVFRVLIHNTTQTKTQTQTQTQTLHSSSSSSTSIANEDTLYSRLVPAGDHLASVIPILDQWVTAAKPIDPDDVRKIIKQFRKYKRFKHALEISDWMGDMQLLDLTPGDIAVQLDLISKVHGLEQAEKYFNTIPESLRVFQVYGALLNCYADSKSLEKAEAIMQKMRELGYCKILGYNVMLTLYSQMGKYDKIGSLLQEIEEKGIDRDRYSFNIHLNAYVSASDIEGMEKLLMKMEINPEIVMDWNPYVIAAKGYLEAGDEGKALAVLQKAEQLIWRGKVNSAYQILMTVYARMGNKSHVYRIWDLLKKFGKFRNMNYLAMISSLEKFDDIEGAEKILEEWEANKTYFDIRLPNMMVTAYCKRGHLDKAELLINRLMDSGFQPNASTWSRIARGCCKYNDMEKAVEMLKKAILISDRGAELFLPTLASCLEYLKERGDTNRAEELIRLLDECSQFSVDLKERIIEYFKRGNLASEEFSESEGAADKTLEEDILGRLKVVVQESC